ncbi:phytoene desaturase family protein [Paenibacillus harenae]|uniref:phytoene desaturase family protein n=1 Tax=Paenibacillus harenae TaxID=306543 RepID=UPI00040F0B2F|nr:NAD(P)/FAD-dependent oxidoreductase [Paenibacillus harenae]
MTDHFDVAIVGGGIAGLTAALYLAKGGKKVVVLELQDQLGGRAITNKKNGVSFNLGSHALYAGDAYHIFHELQLNQDIFRKVDEFHPYGIWKENIHYFPASTGFLMKSQLLSVSDKVKFGALLMKILRLDTASMPSVSLRTWMENNVRSPMIRHLLYVMARGGTYVQAPDLQVAGPLFRQMQRSITGVYYIKQGWGALVCELTQQARRLGVALVTGRKVASVDHMGGRVYSVTCTNKEHIPASQVILTTPPKVTSKLVPFSEQTSLKTWEEQAIPITAACLDIGLRRLPSSKHQFVYGVDQPVMMVNASRIDGLELSEQDDVQLFQMIKFQNENCDPQQDRKELEDALDLVQPGWRREVVTEQFLPRMTVVHDFMHMKRKENPGPVVPEIRGLYVAGDWATHGEYLVDGAAASAKRAAQHILTQ